MRRCPRWQLPRVFGGFQFEATDRAHIPAFLVPFTARYHQSCRRINPKPRDRRNIDTTSKHRESIHASFRTSNGGSISILQAIENAQNKHPDCKLDSVEVWAAALDHFLPRQLQETCTPDHRTQDIGVLCHEIVSILSRARLQHGIDVLEYIGVGQGRWQAVIWIVKTLSESFLHIKEQEINVVAFGSILDGKRPLDSKTRGLHKARPTFPSRSSTLTIDNYASNRFDINGQIIDPELPTHMNPQSQIFQSLGSLILAASEQSSEQAKNTLSYIRQIFAYLHHMDVLPDKIYDWHTNQDPTALQRPPTLHLLSSRILTSLSDAMWRAREEYVAHEAKAAGVDFVYEGHEVPGARYRLKVRDLGPEVWMELLLWSCVDAGYMEEGAWILSKVQKQTDPYKWSVISWSAVQDPSQRVAPSEATVDWDRAKGRFGGPVGKIEGYSFDPPLVQLGERTVSTEVIAALIDGLINNIWIGVGVRGQPVRKVLEYILVLKNILERDQYGLGDRSWNQIILRLLESQGIDVESDPGIMETVLELAPTYKQEIQTVNTPYEVTREGLSNLYALDRSSIAIGLLHRSLSVYVTSGNLTGALRVFSHMQAYLDKNMRKAIKEFAGELADRTNKGMDDSDLYPNEDEPDQPDMVGLVPWIHPTILAKFLDLITEAEAFRFGKWLIYAKDVDGPIIRESSYDQLAPALLRFASATDDNLLLGRVGGIVKKQPYSVSVDIALMQCQVKMGNWKAVQSQLRRLDVEPGLSWKSEHAAILCHAVLELQDAVSTTSQNSLQLALSRAQEILVALLGLEYGFPAIPSSIGRHKIQPLSPPEYRLLQNTWFRHILAVISSASPVLSALCPKVPVLSRPTSILVHLPLQTMTIILSAIVMFRSPKVGKDFFDLWFGHPTPRMSAFEVGGGGTTTVPKRRDPVERIEGEMMDEDDVDLELRFDNDFKSFESYEQEEDPRDSGGFGKLKPTIQCINIVVKEAILRSNESKTQVGEGNKASTDDIVEKEDDEIFAWAVKMYRSFGVNEDELPQGFHEWARGRIL